MSTRISPEDRSLASERGPGISRSGNITFNRDKNVRNLAASVSCGSASVRGDEMRCAKAERNRDHVSFREFQVNASLSFYEGYKRDPVAVQSDALAHHTGGYAFDDYAHESVKISRWAIGSANRNAFWAQAQDDGRAGLD